jgi:superfamily II DNA or RNA helicase
MNKIKPRPHQFEAINAIVKGLEQNDVGHVVMACGTGKTLTALWVKEEINPRITLVLAPSLGLLHQIFHSWQENASKHYEWLCVCSDESVVGDHFFSNTSQLGVPVTNNPVDIAAFLAEESNQVVFSTYHSSHLIGQAQQYLDAPIIDLIIADEAHRTSGNPSNPGFASCLSDYQIRACKRLFLTATPRVFTEAVKADKEKIGVRVASMDDDSIYGTRLYTLSFNEAINLGLLTDYRVVISVIDQPSVYEAIKDNRIIAKIGAEVLASHVAVSKAIKEHGARKVITFHSRIKSAFDFVNRHPVIHSLVSPGETLECLGVSGKMNAKERSQALDILRRSSDQVSIISNARCLSEGIDVPALDAIVFIDPKGSVVDVAQAVGRAIRLSPGKQYGYIIIPVFIQKGENPISEIETSRFKVVWRTLNALRSHDESLSQELDYLRISKGKRAYAPAAVSFSKIHIDLTQSRLAADFANALKTQIVANTTQKWHEQYGALLEYVEEHGAMYPKGHPNARFIDIQRTTYKQRKMPEERILLLESLPGWSWNTKDAKWHEACAFVEKQVNIAGEIYNLPDCDLPDGRKMLSWIANQITEFTKGGMPVERIQRLESIKGWKWSRLDARFDSMYDRLKQHIEKTGDVSMPDPPPNDQYKELTTWILGLRARYRKGTLKQEYQDALNTLPEWYWDHKQMTFERFLENINECQRNFGRFPKRGEPGYNSYHNFRSQWRAGKLPDWKYKVLSGYPGFFS